VSLSIEGDTVLITGGNTGIGRATAVELARRGARVVFTSRDAERGRAAQEAIRLESGRDDVELMELDLADLRSVRRCAETFLERHSRLDVLINNAGINLVRGLRQRTRDGFEMHLGVNHLGHFVLTRQLIDLLKQSAPSRIVNLSSHAYLMAPEGLDFEDLQMEKDYNAFTCYGHSKLLNIYFTLELANRLEGTGVTVNAVHPGYVKTDLGRWREEDKKRFVAEPKKPDAGKTKSPKSGPDLSKLPPPISAEEGAETSVYVATAPELDGVTGGYFADSAACALNEVGSDAEAAARLWEATEGMLASVSS
jgi:NAD(P)-dependent dehydrogenase (short-subunit alcohol dehydrogenase family)